MRKISVLGRSAVLVLGLAPACTLAFPEGAPPAHTGGFSEPHCGSCHFGEDPPADNRGLRLKDLGDTYEPGQIYEFILQMVDTEKVVGGFQISVRFIDAPGQSAGRLEADGDDLRVIEKDGVQYLGHREVGHRNSDGDDFHWRIRWIAPQTPAGDVVFHVAAVAGNDDESPLGDTVHVLRYRLGDLRNRSQRAKNKYK